MDARQTSMVVLELQRRGLFRTEHQGNTPREIMRLPTPKNRYSERRAIPDALG
jgi:hypothetical protein